jgi:hypothetical protein
MMMTRTGFTFPALVALALTLPACDQAPDPELERTSQGESITLPLCSETCGPQKSCASGCSFTDDLGSTATTCEQYMSGVCDGKGDLIPPPSEGSGGGSSGGSGGGTPNGGIHACTPDLGCRDSGRPRLIGQTVTRVNTATKARPEPRWVNKVLNTYAQPQFNSRQWGSAPCFPIRCSCDRIYTQWGHLPPSASWGTRYVNYCAQF